METTAMVAERMNKLSDERGQTILEVIFVLPFLFLFVGLLFKVNTAIQMAINNTQFAHSQLYVLTANSPEYPRIQFRFLAGQRSFVNQEQDRMVLGVADPENIDFSDPNGNIEPDPQIQKIGRANPSVRGSSDRGEVKKRLAIRVRNTAAICTQLNSVSPKVGMTSDHIPALKAKRWPFGEAVCQYKGDGGEG